MSKKRNPVRGIALLLGLGCPEVPFLHEKWEPG